MPSNAASVPLDGTYRKAAAWLFTSDAEPDTEEDDLLGAALYGEATFVVT